MIWAVDMGSVFALARYAAEKAKPLTDQIPGACLGVEALVDDKWASRSWHVGISVHRVVNVGGGETLAPMVLQDCVLADSESVDRVVEELRRIVREQSWPLHDAEKAAA